MLSVSIGDALFTKTQQRVLGLLFGKPDARFYTNEIVRLANMGRGAVKRELDRLTAAGVIVMAREGNQHYCQANAHSPVYAELVAITRKTFGVVEAIRVALQPLVGLIELSFVYGSLANTSDVKTSDIDLMVVGDGISDSDVVNVLLPLEQSLGRQINPSIYSKVEFRTKLEQGSSFIERVMDQPNLWVKGSDDDIGECGQFG